MYIYIHIYPPYIHHISQDIPRILVGEFLYTNTQQARLPCEVIPGDTVQKRPGSTAQQKGFWTKSKADALQALARTQRAVENVFSDMFSGEFPRF
jgi:hypothetical protein